jgi:hypothetical protein
MAEEEVLAMMQAAVWPEGEYDEKGRWYKYL